MAVATKGSSTRGIQKLLNAEEYEEYMDMIRTYVSLPKDKRLGMKVLSELVERRFGIKLSTRTINDHALEEETVFGQGPSSGRATAHLQDLS